MKIWRSSDGHVAREVPAGDVYVNADGYYFLRNHDDVVLSRVMWKVVSRDWAQLTADQLTEHDKYYLAQSLGLDPDALEAL